MSKSEGADITSAKIVQWGCRDRMHNVKNCGNKEIPLAILSWIVAKSNPFA